jgi:hypothetical protein
MHYAHDEKESKHKVTSHHGEGILHEASHSSPEEAHGHMAKAMGIESANEEGQQPEESPDDSQEPQYASAGGGGIPGLNS